MRKTIKLVVLTILVLFLIVLGRWAILPEIAPEWTGFGPYDKDPVKVRSKTLWDWLDLLVIPIFLIFVAWLIKEFERININRKETFDQEQKAIDSFISTITELILEYDLLEDQPKSGANDIARTRVHYVLNILKGSSKGQILQFLYESNLIGKDPIINLNGANLCDSKLDGIVLVNAVINGAYFNNTSLTNSNLENTILIGSNFEDAKLDNCEMVNTNLSFANCTNCSLKNIDLTSVVFEETKLEGANLTGSKITHEQKKLFHSLKNINLKNVEVYE